MLAPPTVVLAWIIKAEQMVKASGTGPASKVALVYSPLLSISRSLSSKKSSTFTVETDLGCRSRVLDWLILFCSRNFSFRYLVLHGFDCGMVLRSPGKIRHEAKVTAKKKRNKLEGIVMSAKIIDNLNKWHISQKHRQNCECCAGHSLTVIHH